MIETKNICWLAGYLEGEGSFTIYRPSKNSKQFRIELSSTDLDVITKVKSIIKTKQNIYLRKLRGGHKQEYYIKVYSNLAIQWMMTIYTLMGIRRKDKINLILSEWKIYIDKGSGLCRMCSGRLHYTTIRHGLNKGKRTSQCPSCRRIRQRA